MKHHTIGRATAAGLVALAILATGCSSGKPTAKESPSENPEARAESRVDPATLRIAVTGAHPLEWSGPVDLRVARTGVFGGPVNLLSIGLEAPRNTQDPLLRFRWAVDLLNVYADKPGTFEILPEKEASGSLQSLAFLILLKVKESARDKAAVEDWAEVEFLKEFRKREEGCSVEIGEGQRTGKLSCSKLATEEGEIAGFEVTWEPRAA